jgi:5-methylcytosine-specific restriction protein A
MPRRPCAYPGCPELVQRGYCEKHAAAARQRFAPRPQEDKATHRLYDRAWQRRRKAHLAAHPWCEDCLATGIYTPATDVHHEIRHRGDPVLFATSPLRSLCHECHSRRTAGEVRQGEGG